MSTRKFLLLSSVAMALALLPWGMERASAGPGLGVHADMTGGNPTFYANSPAGNWTDWNGVIHNSGTALRKFVDGLPLLGPGGATTIEGTAGTTKGLYIPVAVPDKAAFANCDYYEIGIVEYTQWMHSDLPKATRLRGYVQLETATIKGKSIPLFYPDGVTPIMLNGTQALAVDKPSYLGPVIVATRGTPVRIKYSNLLPTGPTGDLFIPVDHTLMGAGMGPDGVHSYTENRIAIHLHGGHSAWVSDGTPHQWTVPVGETAATYMNGVSFQNVPDMANPGQGSGTLYYINDQPARLMFYHDHALGITRLNVYVGQAAGYLVTDPAGTGENTLPLPTDQIPLVIQDKTFVPQDIAVQDAKWDTTHWGLPGDLWFPHVYETNQDPTSIDGTNPVGRWDWGPWFWPVFPSQFLLPTGVYGDVTTTPEAFMDTPVVNGVAYPVLQVEPRAYRFRILAAGNDRFFNLGLYMADPSVTTGDGRSNTEVRMVPFNASSTVVFPPYWGTVDATLHPAGVPDPNMTGPDIVQIGSEGGLLPAVHVIPSTPINYEYNKRSVTVLNVLEHGLWLGPAERADAVIDFSQFAGQTLILVNDAPAPLPAGDPRVDYYTNGPDQSAFGGAASTLPGYGPNTRTIMQIRVAATVGAPGTAAISTIRIVAGGAGYTAPTVNILVGGVVVDTGTAVLGLGGAITSITPNTPALAYAAAPTISISDLTGTGAFAVAFLTPSPAFSVAALTAALPAVYGATQDMPIVAQTAYDPAFGTTSVDNYARIYVGTLNQPNFVFTSGDGTKGVALTLVNGGSGYASAPGVAIGAPPPGGLQATAATTLSVLNIIVNKPGSGYSAATTVTLSPPQTVGGVRATATATVVSGKITAITVVNPGSGYTIMPTVTFGNVGAGKGASATAKGTVTSITVTNPGYGYTSVPAVNFTGSPGSGAVATAALTSTVALPVQNKAIQELFEPTYGRMNATLGVELPFTGAIIQTTIPLGYVDPTTETMKDGETQIWKITHNGVDSHPVHFHLVNVQLINRVGWDGTVKPPHENEVGWKETIKMHPLEDVYVAVRTVAPKLLFGLPESNRMMDPSQPAGSMMGFTQIDPATGNPKTVTNAMANYGWEYVWHCHILGHEENDFMRPFVFKFTSAVPPAPTMQAPAAAGGVVTLTWTDAVTALSNPQNEVGFTVERATSSNFKNGYTVFTVPANSTQFRDGTVGTGILYYYQVHAFNAAGISAPSNTVTITP